MNNKVIIIGMVVMAVVVFGLFSLKANNSGVQGITGNAIQADSGEAQVVLIGLTRNGFTPSQITVKAGKPVTLKNDGTLGGCGLYPNQPEIGMAADFSTSDEYTFTPKKTGTFTYTCSMGMFKGQINII